jgi:hypothetical protein
MEPYHNQYPRNSADVGADPSIKFPHPHLLVSPDVAVRLEQIILFELVRDSAPDEALGALKSRISGEIARGGMFPPLGAVPHALGLARIEHEDQFRDSVHRSAEAHMELLTDLGSEGYLKRVAKMFQETPCEALRYALVQPRTSSPYWGFWSPGIDNDQMTLGDVLNTLPGVSETAIPEIVQRYENPNSSVALPGAVSLARHDALHVLLGLGLLDQDEAFVIGFTMGNSSRYEDTHGQEMERVFAESYPEPFRIWGDKLIAFRLGVESGRRAPVKDLCEQPIERFRGETLGTLRARFGIDTEALGSQYTALRAAIPHSFESLRLLEHT